MRRAAPDVPVDINAGSLSPTAPLKRRRGVQARAAKGSRTSKKEVPAGASTTSRVLRPRQGQYRFGTASTAGFLGFPVHTY